MRVGVMIESQMGLDWTRWGRILESAERCGYQSVFLSDHFVDPRPPDRDALEAWTALTYAAVKTSRVEFGALVSPVTFRHPALLVRQAAAVDALSGGRLLLGLGAGWQAREHHNYGIPFPDLGTRFELLADALEITRRLYREAEAVSYAGRHLSIEDAVLLPRPKCRTPIIIGGNGPRRTLPLAARYADEWNGVYIDVPTFARLNHRLDELIEAEGRAPAEVKRSLMLPFSQVAGGDALDRLHEYADAGCERFMLQYTDYDDLAPLERWADACLPRLHPRDPGSRTR